MEYSARIARAISMLAVAASTAGCVFVGRYSYISIEPTSVQVDATAMIEVDGHVGSKGPIPSRYSLEHGGYLITFARDPSDHQGGVTISASASQGLAPTLRATESPLAEPGYGACRAYYQDSESGGLYFFDQCPSAIVRDYRINLDLVRPTGQSERISVPYSVQRAGFWWQPDSL